MATTENIYQGDGFTTLFPFSFPYISEQDIVVSIDGTATTEYTLANPTTVEFNTAPAAQARVSIRRESEDEVISATFFAGSAIRADDLNDNFEQLLFIAQETKTFAQNTEAGQIAATAQEALDQSETALSQSNYASVTANQARDTANAAVQPGDNISELTNDAGYLQAADLTSFGVSSFNGQNGVVVLTPEELGAVASTGGTFTGSVEFPAISIEGVSFTADPLSTGAYTLPAGIPSRDLSYLATNAGGDLQWVDRESLLPDDGAVGLINIYYNRETIAGSAVPSDLPYGRGKQHYSAGVTNSQGFGYINNAGDFYLWGANSESFLPQGYSTGNGKYRKQKVYIPYENEENRKAWQGDPDYAHLRTNLEGEPLLKFSDMGKVRHVEMGIDGCAVITENGRLYTCGYGGYGGHGLETATNALYHLKPVRFWNPAASSPYELADFPKIKQVVRSDAGTGYNQNTLHSMYALDQDGHVYSCGYNGYGQLGDNTATYSAYFKRIDPSEFNNEKVVFITACNMGYTTLWALTETGKCYIWGYTGYSLYNYDLGAYGYTSLRPSDLTENPVNSLFGKKVIHVAPGGDAYDNKCWYLCDDGTVHAQGYERNTYRMLGLDQRDFDAWMGDGSIADRVAAAGSTTPPTYTTAARSFPYTVQLDSEQNHINSDNQKVIAMWQFGGAYGGCMFLTDGGDSGEKKMYCTEANDAGYRYSGDVTGARGDGLEVVEMKWQWTLGKQVHDGNNLLPRMDVLNGAERKANIDAGFPVAVWSTGYYSSVHSNSYMIDSKGYTWFCGYEGANYGPNGHYTAIADTGGSMGYAYGWTKVANLPEGMTFAADIAVTSTVTSNARVCIGLDSNGNIWGGHSSDNAPSLYYSPTGLDNPHGTNTSYNTGEVSWTLCPKF